MTITITSWDEKEFTLDDLEELVADCDAGEQSFDELAGAGDLATSPAIIQSLVEKVRELERFVQIANEKDNTIEAIREEFDDVQNLVVSAYKEVTGREDNVSHDEARSLLMTACFSTRKQLLNALDVDVKGTKYED